MQSIFEAFRLAARAIRSYKLRSLLTLLGVTVGIFAIVLTFTVVDSLQYSISSNLSQLGPTVLYVHKWPWKDNSEDWHKYVKRPKMSLSDYRILMDEMRIAEDIAFQGEEDGQRISADGLDVTGVKVKGIIGDYMRINGLNLANGRPFTEVEIANGRPKAILGHNVAERLFPNRNPVGERIKVRGKRLDVVGVLTKQGANFFGQSQDDGVLIPYHQLANLYDMGGRFGVNTTLTVRAGSAEEVPRVEDRVTALIRQVRGLRPDVENNFSINRQEALMRQLNDIFRVLNMGGSFIASFALLVGGFGIANIMFVAVKERTKEIGMQKAMGARRMDILLQFLIEAILLCLMGALVGIGLVLALIPLGSLVEEIQVTTEPDTIAWGIFLGVMTGILAGFLPAAAAARLNPVEAIRSGG